MKDKIVPLSELKEKVEKLKEEIGNSNKKVECKVCKSKIGIRRKMKNEINRAINKIFGFEPEESGEGK